MATTTITMSGRTLASVIDCAPDHDADETFTVTVDDERVSCYGPAGNVGPDWTPTRQQLVDAGELDD